MEWNHGRALQPLGHPYWLGRCRHMCLELLSCFSLSLWKSLSVLPLTIVSLYSIIALTEQTYKQLCVQKHNRKLKYVPFCGCFYPKCLMVTQGNKYICGMGGLSREGTPKQGTVTCMLCSALLSAVPPQSDYTSSEHFSICFPLEMVWHFVVVRRHTTRM